MNFEPCMAHVQYNHFHHDYSIFIGGGGAAWITLYTIQSHQPYPHLYTQHTHEFTSSDPLMSAC